jgi:hypothetical protein
MKNKTSNNSTLVIIIKPHNNSTLVMIHTPRSNSTLVMKNKPHNNSTLVMIHTINFSKVSYFASVTSSLSISLTTPFQKPQNYQLSSHVILAP